MFTITALVEGVAPLLQNRFAPEQLGTMMQGSTKRTGSADRSMEWFDGVYVTQDGLLYQPNSHLEGALAKAATAFKIKGARGKSWREPIRAYCYVMPEQLLHLRDGKSVKAPGRELLHEPEQYLAVNVSRVKVQRSAVARSRLLVAPGWQLKFMIEVHDEQVREEVVREILVEAGRAVGIGDNRPRYGRFAVVDFSLDEP